MLQVMQQTGWLNHDDKGWFAPNWAEHQGHIVAYRSRGKAMADARWRKARDATSNAYSNAVRNARSDPIEVQQQTNTRARARPSLAEVKAQAQVIGCPQAEAEAFWNHFEASGWVDKNGNAVVSWTNKLATWTATARSKPLEAAHHANGAGATVAHSKELDRVLDAIRSIKATYGDHQTWAQDDVERCRKLIARRNELRKALGVVV